ncbi:MAG: acyl--CoA ligase [Marinovum sp.]|nr:acyl--CoA ligase [Marinovum sp.]
MTSSTAISVLDRQPCPVCPAPFNMAAHVLRHAARVPHKLALSVVGDGAADDWSYGRLERAIRGTATGLLACGLAPGDRVLLRLGNTPDFPVAYLAALAVDLVPVPTSPSLTKDEVAVIVDIVTPALSLTAPGVACPASIPQVEVTQLRGWHDLTPAEFVFGDPNRLGYIVFTSGTSGHPRAVAHAHRAIWARGMMLSGWYAMHDTDRILHAGGFNWTFTLGTGLMDPWSLGATALIPTPGTPPTDVPGMLHKHQATLFAGAPAVFRQMLKAATQPALPDLRHALSAGESLPQTLREAFRETYAREIYEAYGMSECSTFISAHPGAAAPPGSIGTAQQGRKIALLDDAGPVALGDIGEIAVAEEDPGLLLGYWQKGGALNDPRQDGWFRTGDFAALDSTGQITYHGRRDDMMNAGGFRVSPAEVEAVIGACAGIESVAVTDVEIKPDVRVIAAFYTASTAIPEKSLKSHAAAHLARYKQPRLYAHVDTLPTGPNGKLSRRALREMFVPDASF